MGGKYLPLPGEVLRGALWELNENEPGQSLWRHKDETQEVSRSHSSVY